MTSANEKPLSMEELQKGFSELVDLSLSLSRNLHCTRLALIAHIAAGSEAANVLREVLVDESAAINKITMAITARTGEPYISAEDEALLLLGLASEARARLGY